MNNGLSTLMSCFALKFIIIITKFPQHCRRRWQKNEKTHTVTFNVNILNFVYMRVCNYYSVSSEKASGKGDPKF